MAIKVSSQKPLGASCSSSLTFMPSVPPSVILLFVRAHLSIFNKLVLIFFHSARVRAKAGGAGMTR
jgi:hypothetical protein